jgi:hypothetical protein
MWVMDVLVVVVLEQLEWLSFVSVDYLLTYQSNDQNSELLMILLLDYRM